MMGDSKCPLCGQPVNNGHHTMIRRPVAAPWLGNVADSIWICENPRPDNVARELGEMKEKA
jgi:C4-type Zn-finger protein